MVCCLNNILPRKVTLAANPFPTALSISLKNNPANIMTAAKMVLRQAAKRDAVSMSSIGAVRPSHTSQKIVLTAVKCVSVSKWLTMVNILPYKGSVRMLRVTMQIYRISNTCIFLSPCSFKSHQEIFRNRAFSLQKALWCYF